MIHQLKEKLFKFLLHHKCSKLKNRIVTTMKLLIIDMLEYEKKFDHHLNIIHALKKKKVTTQNLDSFSFS